MLTKYAGYHLGAQNALLMYICITEKAAGMQLFYAGDALIRLIHSE